MWQESCIRLLHNRTPALRRKNPLSATNNAGSLRKEYGMIKLINRLILIFAIGVVVVSAAFAETIKKEVKFSRPFVVNGTELKEGTYTVAFDDQTNELSIIKGRKVIAKAPARLEKRDVPEGGYLIREEGEKPGKRILVTVALRRDNQATLTNTSESATNAP